MPNIAWKLVGDTLVAVHNTRSFTDAEGLAYIEEMVEAANARGGDLSTIRNLVFTEGGGPNAAQRKIASERLQKLKNWNKATSAVVSNATSVRGIVTVLHWFNMNIKGFPPHRIDEAFAFLGIGKEEAEQILAELPKLKAQLGP
jgi:hypothetical protein